MGLWEIIKLIVKKAVGLIVFILVWLFANFLTLFISNPVFLNAVDFVNDNIFLILVFSFIFFLSEVFKELPFPLNLPYPIFNAVGSVILVNFFFEIFGLIDQVVNTNLYNDLNSLKYLVVVVVFIVTLISGYVGIFSKGKRRRRRRRRVRHRARKEHHQRRSKDEHDETEWSDVGEEIKETFHDGVKKVRSKINKKQ